MERNRPLLASINSTYERSVEDQLGLSKNLIRSMVKSGVLPCVHVGNSMVLINYQQLLNLIYEGTPVISQAVTTPKPGQIMPIPEKLQLAK